MSHFTTIQTQVRDLDALRQALGELGVTLHEKTNARGYAGNTLKGDSPSGTGLDQSPAAEAFERGDNAGAIRRHQVQ